MNANNKERFIQMVRDIVITELHNQNLLRGEWHLGRVNSVISPKLLSVFVDGASTPQNVPCNPDITFSAGNEVWVTYINGEANNKFVFSKRAV